MLISKDMVVKGCFSQPKIFKIIFSFLGPKIAFKNIYYTLEDFLKFKRPFKRTVNYEVLRKQPKILTVRTNNELEIVSFNGFNPNLSEK